jgi:hypothetical protein
VKVAQRRGLYPGNIMSEFWITGIFPLDRHVSTDEDLFGSYATDRPHDRKVISGVTNLTTILTVRYKNP